MGKDQRFVAVEVIDYPFVMWQPEILQGFHAVIMIAANQDPDVRADHSDPFNALIGYPVPCFTIRLISHLIKQFKGQSVPVFSK